MAAPYTAILRQLTSERFAAVLEPLNRQSKERYFARHQVRAPKVVGAGLGKPGHKNAVRAGKLHAVLQERDDEPLAEEMLRLYLLHRRDMLVAALDYLGIAHEGGLTESPELGRFATLSGQARQELLQHLVDRAGTDAQDAEMYLAFMAQSSQPES